MPNIITRCFLFKGHVQGVGFRRSCLNCAQELPVAGQVRNLLSGDVELYAQGSPESIEALLAAIKAKRSENIKQIEEVPAKIHRFNGFKISV